jgi:DNA repair and recombination protein RadB
MLRSRQIVLRSTVALSYSPLGSPNHLFPSLLNTLRRIKLDLASYECIICVSTNDGLFLDGTISTGCVSLDKLLGGGIPEGRVSLVYGEAETGKTSFAIQCAVNCARTDYKTVFIDADGTFSSRRLLQIAYHDIEKLSPLIILFRPQNFQEQANVIDHLEKYLTEKTRLLIFDTITSLYRVEFGSPPERKFELNRELNTQLAYLAQIAKTQKLAVLITSQVRSTLTEKQINVEPVATRVLKFWSDIVLRFKRTGQTRVIKVFLEKHPKRKHPPSRFLMIDGTGIRDLSR